LKYDSKGEDILKNISFEISKGQKIAIIGRYLNLSELNKP